MRANTHRQVLEGGHLVGVEVASSPDTPDRPERWAWHLRLHHASAPHGQPLAHDTAAAAKPPPSDAKRLLVELGTDQPYRVLEVVVDPALVSAEVELAGPGEDRTLVRAEEELLALVATSGQVELEERHLLRAGDAIVLTGDDPLEVRARTADGTLVLVRLRSRLNGAIGWVP